MYMKHSYTEFSSLFSTFAPVYTQQIFKYVLDKPN